MNNTQSRCLGLSGRTWSIVVAVCLGAIIAGLLLGIVRMRSTRPSVVSCDFDLHEYTAYMVFRNPTRQPVQITESYCRWRNDERTQGSVSSARLVSRPGMTRDMFAAIAIFDRPNSASRPREIVITVESPAGKGLVRVRELHCKPKLL